ncbi:AAA-associated domain-containing protein [bacterium]|nr:AAA-associated domain-containing protein [bacterium]
MDGEPLPSAEVEQIIGLLEILDDLGGKEDIPKLARSLQFELDDLLPVIRAAELLGFVVAEGGDIEITDWGYEFLRGNIQERKEIFARAVMEVPWMKKILELLKANKGKPLQKDEVLEIFLEDLSEEEADLLLRTAISWGRYAELFGYDQDEETLFLDIDEEED